MICKDCSEFARRIVCVYLERRGTGDIRFDTNEARFDKDVAPDGRPDA